MNNMRKSLIIGILFVLLTLMLFVSCNQPSSSDSTTGTVMSSTSGVSGSNTSTTNNTTSSTKSNITTTSNSFVTTTRQTAGSGIGGELSWGNGN